MPAVLKSLHSSRLLQSKRYELCGTISANPCPFRKTAAAPKILCSHNQETGINCEPVHVILSSPQGDAPMRPIQAYVPKERILPSREIVKEGHVPMGLEGSGASLRPGSIVRVLRTERWVQPTERAGSEGSFICRCLGQRKPYNRPAGVGNAFPLWWLVPPPFRPSGKRVTGFSVAYGSLRIQFPCHRKRGHYKAPLCCERLMKGLFFRALLSHRSAG